MIFRTMTGIQFMQGEVIPWYLGRVRWDLNTDSVLLAPVPINFLMGWAYEAWWRIRRGPEGIQKRLEAARAIGFHQGHDAGVQQCIYEIKNFIRTVDADYLHNLLSKRSSGDEER